MTAASISAGTSAIRQMLARAIAILAVAMLVAHAAAAKGVVSHDHDHALAHVGEGMIVIMPSPMWAHRWFRVIRRLNRQEARHIRQPWSMRMMHPGTTRPPAAERRA